MFSMTYFHSVKKIALGLALVLSVLLMDSCSLSTASRGTGSVSFSIPHSRDTGTSVVAFWKVSGAGPGSAEFASSAAGSQQQLVVTDLIPGIWTISVLGLDIQNDPLYSKKTTITIVPGDNELSITLEAVLPTLVAQWDFENYSKTQQSIPDEINKIGLSGVSVDLPYAYNSNYGAYFDGQTSGAFGTSAYKDLPAPWTVSFWIEPQVGGTATILFSSKTGTEIQIGPDANQSLELALSPDGTVQSLFGTVLPNDIWIHVVVVNTGSKVQSYFNGVPGKSLTDAASTGTKLPFDILGADFDAKRGSFEDFFTGSIDDLRIYGTAMGAAQVAILYQGYPFAVTIDTAQMTGGSVNITPAPNYPGSNLYYKYGTQVQLTPVPGLNYTFFDWIYSDESSIGTDVPLILTLTAARKSIIAEFNGVVQ